MLRVITGLVLSVLGREIFERMPSYDQVKPFLRTMDKSRTYSNNGPLVQDLERQYANKFKVDAKTVVAVSNATVAIEGFLSISSADEWLIPSYTFSATGLAGMNSGKKITLGDSDEKDWQLKIDAADFKSSKGIVPVLPFGQKINLEKYSKFEHVLVDAAASIAEFPDLSPLKSGWAVVYSLHATKLLGAGEGGLIIFGSTEMANRFRKWINFGFYGSRESTSIGTNAKMSEIHAAYATASLNNWKVDSALWVKAQDHAQLVSERFSDLFTHWQPKNLNPYWIVSFEDQDQMLRLEHHLMSERISTRRWWSRPLHEMPAFNKVERDGPLEVASKLSNSVLGLPMFCDITPSDFKRIEKSIKHFCQL